MRPVTRKMMNAECGMMNENVRGLRNSSFIIHHSSFRGAFSLLELMIAIMILGIGLVMVATVFPIGIDMAAQNVQMYISQEAVDTAEQTLKLKVPMRTLDWGGGVPVAILPSEENTFLDLEVNDYDAIALAARKLDDSCNDAYSNAWSFNYLTLFPFSQNYDPRWGTKLRYFTGRTGWAGEVGGGWYPERLLGFNLEDYAFALPTQNLQPAYNTVTDLRLLQPVIPASLGPVAHLWRLNLVDRVYPPVPLTATAWDSANSTFTTTARLLSDVVRDLADRRHSWIAFYHRRSAYQSVKSSFIVTIVVTHRADPTAKFARQEGYDGATAPYVPVFTGSARDKLLIPKRDPSTDTDMLFPQPWLVRLKQVSVGMGEVRCSKEIARLLPVGSYFVVARSNGPALIAGTPHEILGRPDPAVFEAYPKTQFVTLQVRRGNDDTWRNDVYAWVVPPALDRAPSGNNPDLDRFRNKTPIVGVAMRIVE